MSIAQDADVFNAVTSKVPLPLSFIEKPPDLSDREWFGRYRLWFDQVSPRFDDIAAVVRIRPDCVDDIAALLESLPEHQNWPFHLVKPGANVRDSQTNEGFSLCFEMLSDVCYIDMRNFHWAVRHLAPHLEDAHFFVYSSGDGYHCWIDEYRLNGGIVTAHRHTWPQASMRDSRIDFYFAEIELREPSFRAFVRQCVDSSPNPMHQKYLSKLI
jgi:hypothetical protein